MAVAPACAFRPATYRMKRLKRQPPARSRARPGPAPALDLRNIIRAALELLDQAGFDGLTMRNLAERLGVKAASLYWHIQSKQDLLSLVADEICAPIHPPDPGLPWQRQLEALGKQYRAALLSHRDAARVLGASGSPSGPNILRLTEIVLATLLHAGFKGKDAAYAGSLLNDYVVMFVLEERRAADMQAQYAAKDSAPEASSRIAALPAQEYPSLRSLADELMWFDADARFRFGTETLIHGLEARLAKRKG